MGPSGPRIYIEQCSRNPAAYTLHTIAYEKRICSPPSRTHHFPVIPDVWARTSAPHLRRLVAPTLMDEEGSEDMEDPDPDPGPPRKRIKTTRDYEREARRPDKSTRQMLKRGAPSLGSTTTPSMPRSPRTPRPLTVFGGGHREPSWPPPLPPSRTRGREPGPSSPIEEPRTPSPPQDMAEVLPDVELEQETDSWRLWKWRRSQRSRGQRSLLCRRRVSGRWCRMSGELPLGL